MSFYGFSVIFTDQINCMNPIDVQKKIFDHIKASLPPHIALADEISDIFSISHDSAYRRLRGETQLSLGELQTICRKYNFSLDRFLHLQNGSTIFETADASNEGITYEGYLQGIVEQLRFINQFQSREMFYLCKDLPYFYFFHTRELALFKSYFWKRSILNHTDVEPQFSISTKKFEEALTIGMQMIAEYNKMPSTELWNVESINSTFHQIEYCREAGIFESVKDIEAVYDSFEAMIIHLRNQCQFGLKYFYGKPAPEQGFEVKLLVNEIILGSNTIVADIDSKKIIFIPYNVLSYLVSTDEEFIGKAQGSFKTLANKSTLISKIGEKERNRFFNKLLDQIKFYRNRI
jgi:hypothetical protein